MAGKLSIGIAISSTRDNRLGERVVKYVKKAIEKNHNVVVFDPLKMELPVTQQSINFMYNPSVVPKNIQELNAKFAKLDALVIVCGEYNWSIPPPLTNMLDNVPPTTLAWKPVGYVTYSVSPLGGARAAVQLRTFTGGLGMITVPVQLTIPTANTTISEDGSTENDKVNTQLQCVLSHVYWAANAVKAYASKTPPPKWMAS